MTLANEWNHLDPKTNKVCFKFYPFKVPSEPKSHNIYPLHVQKVPQVLPEPVPHSVSPQTVPSTLLTQPGPQKYDILQYEPSESEESCSFVTEQQKRFKVVHIYHNEQLLKDIPQQNKLIKGYENSNVNNNIPFTKKNVTTRESMDTSC